MKLDKWIYALLAGAVLLLVSEPAYAQEAADGYKGLVGLGAGLAIGLGAACGGIAQGIATKAALEGVARNPQASGKITMPMILGLALIESLVIYAMVVAFFLVGKI